jgi:CubicO group peptidase (beta-lactamase class C family)
MILVEQRKVGLEGSITKYFPDAQEKWKSIRVRNLLSHTSGLKDYSSEEMTKAGGPVNLRADYTEAQMLKLIESFPLEFQPGEKW